MLCRIGRDKYNRRAARRARHNLAKSGWSGRERRAGGAMQSSLQSSAALVLVLAMRAQSVSSNLVEAASDCRTDWAGAWSYTPARSFFTGKLRVTQSGCSVTERWWEYVTDWHCRGQWLTGWIEIERNYTARAREIIPLPPQQPSDDCSGQESWRPAAMVLSADGDRANCSSEVWTREPPAPPKPPLPACLPLGECSIGFLDGFGPPCCKGLVLQQDYSSACHHSAGKHGYPEAGLSCQKTACLTMGANCADDRDGCCPGLSCHDMGISGFMCTST